MPGPRPHVLDMLFNLLAFLSGLVVLSLASDRFVLGACALAHNYGISPMVIGLTIVALGTSAPEMVVSAAAAWQGNPGIALGNVLGSNIANVGLVVGGSALVSPIVVASRTLRREFPLLFLVTGGTWLLVADGHLSRTDGGALILALIGALAFVIRAAQDARRRDPLKREIESRAPPRLSSGWAMFWMVVGLLLMIASSKLVVVGASGIARAFGVSDLVIGLTIVAIGTSLPELATSAISVIKGQPDIAIGNVLGSNMFNLLPVLGTAAIVFPFEVQSEALHRDFPIMVAMTIVLFVMCVGRGGFGRVTKVQGGLLLAAFIGYQTTLCFSSV